MPVPPRLPDPATAEPPPQDEPVASVQPGEPPPARPSDNRRSLVIGIAIGVVAVLVVGAVIALVSALGESDGSDGSIGTEAGSESPTADTADAAPTTAASGPLLAASDSAVSETAEIVDIDVESGVYLVDYETTGYTEELPGVHVHFYWNDIYEVQAGEGPSARQWFVWGGPRPFDGYSTADRPDGATQMCIVVANPDHTIRAGTGNCFDLP